MAQISGQRSTGHAITNENILVREVGDQIAMLDPNETPLVTFLMKLNKRRGVYSPRVEWLEDDYVARWSQNGTTTIAAATASTTITVTDGTLFAPGDLIVAPVAATSSDKPEVIRVVSVATNVLTTIRNVGGLGLNAINANASIRILGSAEEEGATPQSGKTTIKSTETSYTEIFRTPVEFTKTQVASKVYGINGSERKREHKKKLVEHKQKMNIAALFNAASEDLTGGPNGKPIRTTQGLNSVITTNVVDAGGLLTKKTFEEFSRSVFRYGSKKKLLLAAPMVISAIHEWGNSFLQLKPGETKFGVNIQRVRTGHGEFVLANDWMLEDGVSGQNGFGATAFAVDLDNCEYVYLSENGESRDTKLMLDIVKDGRDAYVDEILSECGFCFKVEKTHGKIYNVTDYSA